MSAYYLHNILLSVLSEKAERTLRENTLNYALESSRLGDISRGTMLVLQPVDKMEALWWFKKGMKVSRWNRFILLCVCVKQIGNNWLNVKVDQVFATEVIIQYWELKVWITGFAWLDDLYCKRTDRRKQDEWSDG